MENIPFATLINHPQLLKALESLELVQATPVQEKTIPAILDNKNLLVSAKTGSGKTIAFLLPALQKILTAAPLNPVSTRILILSPTRELARQIVKITQQLCRFTSIKVAMVTGGDELKYQKALLRKNPEVLVATPGRLVEHIRHKSTDFSGLEILVLDEADRMLDMGLSEDVLAIAETCYPQRQNLLFSATLEQRGLRHLIKQVMQEQSAEEIAIEDTDNRIQQQIVLADDDKHKEKLLLALLARSSYEKAIVFTNTKIKAAQLDGLLRYNKYSISALHGDMTQDQRKRSLDIFRLGHTRILVATDVAARGLDVEGVDLVINIDMAQSGDDYTHRIGRTGRAEKSGRAVSLIAASEWNLMSSIERYLKVSFERLTLPGLVASYTGPKKVKASGKASGTKKKKPVDTKAPVANKVKVRERDKKNVGKRRAPTANPTRTDEPINPLKTIGDGFAPLRRKRTDTHDLGDED